MLISVSFPKIVGERAGGGGGLQGVNYSEKAYEDSIAIKKSLRFFFGFRDFFARFSGILGFFRNIFHVFFACRQTFS